MKLFITGISGLLGLNTALQAKQHCEISGCYHSHPVQAEGVTVFRLDITSYKEMRDALEQARPDVILHTAGLTNVDRCEAAQILASQLNVDASEHVSRIAQALGAKLIHISTDHLFDGTLALADETTLPHLLNVYARTKWEAEQVVQRHAPHALIVRTNFYGWGTEYRQSFSDRVLADLSGHKDLRMFSDVFFTPILINDLVDILFELLRSGTAGIYNVVGRDRVSKLDFALRLAEIFHYPQDGIRSVNVDQIGLKAPRPKDMSLSCDKVVRRLGRPMPSLLEGLHRLKSLYEQGWHELVRAAAQDGLAEKVR